MERQEYWFYTRYRLLNYLLASSIAGIAFLIGDVSAIPVSMATTGIAPNSVYLPHVAGDQNAPIPYEPVPHEEVPVHAGDDANALAEGTFAGRISESNALAEEHLVKSAIAANSTTYFVDCSAGNDDNSGTSQGNAWQTMERANQAELNPGDRLRFKRGCTWRGPLRASWHGTADRPITIGSYGTGELPIIQNAYSSNVQIGGMHLIIENIHATLTEPESHNAKCNDQPMGWKLGFAFQKDAAYNTVQNAKATKLAIGVYFHPDSHHNRVLNNTITGNNVGWEMTPIELRGATGILLQGDSQEIAHNYFTNNRPICTYNDVTGGVSIELYMATNSIIRHNVSYQDRKFAELGSSSDRHAQNNIFAYNLYVAHIDNSPLGARFIVTRGWHHPHGPVLNTKVYNNSVYLSGNDNKAVTCGMCGNGILTLQNNILWSREPVWSDKPFVEDNNILWDHNGGPLINVDPGSSTRVVDPGFLDPAAGKFNLTANSPAIAAGVHEAPGIVAPYDLTNNVVPVGDRPSIGAFERRNAPWQRVFPIPGRIQAQNYREGGLGVGYHTAEASGNRGGSYREDNVDIQVTEDEVGDYNVGWIADGEWLAYDVYVRATGLYRVSVRVATPFPDRRFRIHVDDKDVTGPVHIPWTGGWQRWTDVTVTVPLTAGPHTLRFVAETGRFNINYMTFHKLQ